MTAKENYMDGVRIASVAGTVWLPDGQPVDGAAVTVTAPGTGRQVSTARTGPAGTYDIYLATAGTYLVIVSAPGRRPAADLVAVGAGRAQHDVVLGNSGALTGVARMTGTGDPVAGTVVTLTDLRGQVVASGMTAADGQYRLDGLDAGDYTLVGTAAGVAPVARTVTVPGCADLAFAARGHRVAALVTGPGGRPFAGAVVTLAGRDGAVAAGVSDGQGAVAFEDIPAGRYTAGAEASGPGVAVARTRRGRVTRADIALNGASAADEDESDSLFLPEARVSPERR